MKNEKKNQINLKAESLNKLNNQGMNILEDIPSSLEAAEQQFREALKI